MSKPLDDLYLEWLYRQVAPVRLKNPARTYWSLLKQMHTTQFIWLVPNDDNRIEDGRNLRYEFIRETNCTDEDLVDPEWLSLECSVLEMMIALSRRLSFEVEREPRDWFWELMKNLEINKHNDALYLENPSVAEEVFQILSALIWRIYREDGYGGLFPLRDAKQDQRDVEIWYQMSSYLLERY